MIFPCLFSVYNKMRKRTYFHKTRSLYALISFPKLVKNSRNLRKCHFAVSWEIPCSSFYWMVAETFFFVGFIWQKEIPSFCRVALPGTNIFTNGLRNTWKFPANQSAPTRSHWSVSAFDMFISNVGSKLLKACDSNFHLEVFPFGRSTMLISGFLLTVFVSFAVCSDVVELTDGSFKSGVDGKDIMLVEFFAPW